MQYEVLEPLHCCRCQETETFIAQKTGFLRYFSRFAFQRIGTIDPIEIKKLAKLAGNSGAKPKTTS